ncbi:hypothetical protein [Streptomyces sp. C8S0]|uniref:hypothetical protein n=1 Tax=Streptomyces sp. C8S0 TaxID=2585716 RepID=UPI0039B0C870
MLFLHTFVSVLLGTELTASEKALLDRALLATYGQAGITTDPRTWQRTRPPSPTS